jgi:hypothetical protein
MKKREADLLDNGLLLVADCLDINSMEMLPLESVEKAIQTITSLALRIQGLDEDDSKQIITDDDDALSSSSEDSATDSDEEMRVLRKKLLLVKMFIEFFDNAVQLYTRNDNDYLIGISH